MTPNPKCAYCREEIVDGPVERRGKLYCCETCAFEASQRTCCTCGAQRTVASSSRYQPTPAPRCS
ncbi:MAG: hypothetical protein HYX92_22510 [Chloroflexi bacterium]|nr:hypothetical protein [Chloroflexota bacterium]